jgi:Flp pilus assembly protein TadD
MRVVWFCIMGGLCGCTATSQQVDPVADWEPAKKKDIRVSLIKTLIDSKAYTSSVPLLRQALSEHPKDPRLHYLMGTVLRERGLYNKAIVSFEHAIKLAPRFGQAFSGLAITLNMQDKHGAALLLHRKAVDLSPKDARLQNNLGFGLSLLSRYSEAVKSYEAALALDPNMRSAYVNLGFSLGLMGKTEAARTAFLQVLRGAEVLNNLALIKELRGDQQGAINLYKEALATQPGLAMARENLDAVESEIHDIKEYK